MRRGRASGFTLIELMIVIAIIAILASIAIPNLVSSRLSANETAAVGTLRNVASAQAQMQTAAKIDADMDGAGEYGYFGELSGAAGVRGPAGLTTTRVDPPMLSNAFRSVESGVVSRSGYVFRVFLPDASGIGIPEAASGGADPSRLPDPNLSETTWCCYAWPANFGSSGNRAFFVNQQGDVLGTNNLARSYFGIPGSPGAVVPAADAAFLVNSTTGDMLGFLAVGATATDGQVWNVVN